MGEENTGEDHVFEDGICWCESETRDVSKLPFGPGSSLWKYWTAGKGLAKWLPKVHKWTALNHALIKAGVPSHMVDGLTTNIIDFVLPGYNKIKNKKGPL